MNQSPKSVVVCKGERSPGARLICKSNSIYTRSASIGAFLVARSYNNFKRFHNNIDVHPFYEIILLTILVATTLKSNSQGNTNALN